MSFCGCLFITPRRPETLLVRILHPEPLRTGRGFPSSLWSVGRGPRAEATRTTRCRHPRLPQRGPHSSILTHQSPFFLFPRSQHFSNLNGNREAERKPKAERRCSEEDGREDPSQQVPCWAGYELGPATILAMHQEITRATRLCPLGSGLSASRDPGTPAPLSQARPLPDFCPWGPGSRLRVWGGGAGGQGSILEHPALQSPQKRAPWPQARAEKPLENWRRRDPRTCLSRSSKGSRQASGTRSTFGPLAGLPGGTDLAEPSPRSRQDL